MKIKEKHKALNNSHKQDQFGNYINVYHIVKVTVLYIQSQVQKSIGVFS